MAIGRGSQTFGVLGNTPRPYEGNCLSFQSPRSRPKKISRLLGLQGDTLGVTVPSDTHPRDATVNYDLF